MNLVSYLAAAAAQQHPTQHIIGTIIQQQRQTSPTTHQ